MEKIQIVKPTTDEGYDDLVQGLLNHLVDVVNTRVMTTHESKIIRDLSAAFYDVVNSSRVVVVNSETVGGFVDISKKEALEIPEKLKKVMPEDGD